MKKELKTNLTLANAEKKAFASIGIGSKSFNIGLSFDIGKLASLASSVGLSVGFGDWGAIKLGISATLGNVTLGLNARVETLKFWVNSSISASVTSKIYDKKGVKISVVDTFSLKVNALAVAVVAVVFAKVAVPLLPTILSYIQGFLSAIPSTLKGLWDVLNNPLLKPVFA